METVAFMGVNLGLARPVVKWYNSGNQGGSMTYRYRFIQPETGDIIEEGTVEARDSADAADLIGDRESWVYETYGRVIVEQEEMDGEEVADLLGYDLHPE